MAHKHNMHEHFLSFFLRILLVCIRHELCANTRRGSKRDATKRGKKQNMKTSSSSSFISRLHLFIYILFLSNCVRWIWFLFRAMFLPFFHIFSCSVSEKFARGANFQEKKSTFRYQAQVLPLKLSNIPILFTFTSIFYSLYFFRFRFFYFSSAC